MDGDIKRVVLRVLESPVSSMPSLFTFIGSAVLLQVRGMGMNSPELLKLVENCPKGAETLVTRIIHILTEQGTGVIVRRKMDSHCLHLSLAPPSPALVEKVRDLYQKRVSDVRFLIPVLIGLEKVGSCHATAPSNLAARTFCSERSSVPCPS